MPEPTTARVTPREGGGITVGVQIPTYSGMAEFEITVERDGDGDWIVFIPSPDELADKHVCVDGYEFTNGIAYLGGPEED